MRIATLITTLNDTDNLIVRGVPVTSTIVEFADDTLAIIDTGMAGNPDLLEQLEEMGYKPADFGLVFNTHLHPDHIGGNRLFTNARILISRKELAYHQSLEGAFQVSALTPGIREDALLREMRSLRASHPVTALIGDPGQIEFLEDHPALPGDIKLIPAPGHSIDDQAVSLRGDARNILATGDALYHRDLWRGPTLPGIHFDEDLFLRSAQRLSEFQGIVVPGHDFAFDTATRAYLQTNTWIPL